MSTGALETKKSPTADQFIATNLISEDGKSKNIQRVVLNNPDGTPQSTFNIDKTGLATNAILIEVRDAIKAQMSLASSVWTDDSGVYYVRRDNVNQGTGAITVSFTDSNGATATPGAGLRPLAATDRDISVLTYQATAAGTGYAIGDFLDRLRIIDVNTNASSIIWFNGANTIEAPAPANVEVANEVVTANIGSLNGAATDATISSLSAKLPASLGAKSGAESLSIIPSPDSFFPSNIAQVGGVAVGSEGLKIITRESLSIANKFFVASLNPTIGTPVAIGVAAQNAFVATAPNILISAGAKMVRLDRLSLSVAVAGTGLSSLRIAVRVSTTNKYTSGGQVIQANANPLRTVSECTVRVGTTAIVAAAEGTDTLRVFNGIIKNAIPAANEIYTIDFGNDSVSEFQVVGRIQMRIPPVVIPAGGCAMINIWGPGQTAAPTYEGMLYFTED